MLLQFSNLISSTVTVGDVSFYINRFPYESACLPYVCTNKNVSKIRFLSIRTWILCTSWQTCHHLLPFSFSTKSDKEHQVISSSNDSKTKQTGIYVINLEYNRILSTSSFQQDSNCLKNDYSGHLSRNPLCLNLGVCSRVKEYGGRTKTYSIV